MESRGVIVILPGILTSSVRLTLQSKVSKPGFRITENPDNKDFYLFPKSPRILPDISLIIWDGCGQTGDSERFHFSDENLIFAIVGDHS